MPELSDGHKAEQQAADYWSDVILQNREFHYHEHDNPHSFWEKDRGTVPDKFIVSRLERLETWQITEIGGHQKPLMFITYRWMRNSIA